MTRAVIVVYPVGPPEHKQLRMLFAHCDRRRFDVRSLVHGGIEDAAAIVAAGLADVVVAAYPRHQGRCIDPTAAVEYVRQGSNVRIDPGPLDDQALYRELLRRGIPADEVQRLLDRPRGDGPGERGRPRRTR